MKASIKHWIILISTVVGIIITRDRIANYLVDEVGLGFLPYLFLLVSAIFAIITGAKGLKQGDKVFMGILLALGVVGIAFIAVPVFWIIAALLFIAS